MTKTTNIILLLSFLAIPFGILGRNVYYGHTYSIFLAVSVFLAMLLPNKWLRAFVIYAGLWFAFVIVMVFLGKAHPDLILSTLDSMLFIWIGMMIYLAVYHSKWTLEQWGNAFCILALIQLVIGLFQYIGIDPLNIFLSPFVIVKKEAVGNFAVGTMGNQNHLAALLAVSFPFFFRKYWRWFIVPMLLGFYICQTSTAFAAVAFGSLYYLWGWKGMLLGVLPATGYFLFVDGNKLSEILKLDRFVFWQDGLRIILSSEKSTFFGLGGGIQWKRGDQLHSEYIQLLWSYGLTGVAIIAGFIIGLLRKNKDRLLQTILIIILVDGIGNHLMHVTVTAIMGVTVFALIERENK
jgi:hypothetical protein